MSIVMFESTDCTWWGPHNEVVAREGDGWPTCPHCGLLVAAYHYADLDDFWNDAETHGHNIGDDRWSEFLLWTRNRGTCSPRGDLPRLREEFAAVAP